MGIVAGILILIMGIAHNIYGEKKQIPDLKHITEDPIKIGSLRIMIFQGGVLLIAVGIVQILVSTGRIELPGVAAYFPLGIILINFITSLFLAAFVHREIFKITMPQFFVFAIIIALQILAI